MLTAERNSEICPRCGEEFPHERGGLSRLDNKTIICSYCEMSESVEDYFGTITPKNKWPVDHIPLKTDLL